mgnify:CR=1 FL=1
MKEKKDFSIDQGLLVKLKIDQALLDSTECGKDFACLSGRKEALYEVIGTLGHNMVEIDGPTPINCMYSANYGALHACKCPVRIAIYKKYGK